MDREEQARRLVALAIAALPPPELSRRAIELSAALPAAESQGLRLGADYLPHITLSQSFVHIEDLDRALDRVDEALRGIGPMRLTITGGGRGRSSIWMTIEPAPALVHLHTTVMDALQSFERPGGAEDAFVDGHARPGDVEWVAGYRRESSLAAFTPHVTLGHAVEPPAVDPVSFDAATIAACHLGRFCSCRRVLRRWTL